jgi:hypothetical protein
MPAMPDRPAIADFGHLQPGGFATNGPGDSWLTRQFFFAFCCSFLGV